MRFRSADVCQLHGNANHYHKDEIAEEKLIIKFVIQYTYKHNDT